MWIIVIAPRNIVALAATGVEALAMWTAPAKWEQTAESPDGTVLGPLYDAAVSADLLYKRVQSRGLGTAR
jgi:hypothetical protein